MERLFTRRFMRMFSMNGQRDSKMSFRVSSLYRLVVDSVLPNWENATEAHVEPIIADVLRNATKGGYIPPREDNSVPRQDHRSSHREYRFSDNQHHPVREQYSPLQERFSPPSERHGPPSKRRGLPSERRGPPSERRSPQACARQGNRHY